MNEQEIQEYLTDNDIRFIRLTFFDVFGEQKNIAIMPEQFMRAMQEGIPFDASAMCGPAGKSMDMLFLEPDLKTASMVPWRSLDGGVVRVLCDITKPDGSPYTLDTRHILKCAIESAKETGISVKVGTEMEFYIFKTDEEGNPTRVPHDEAGYLSVAPRDRGENFRRDICQMLTEMDIVPEASYHEQGPGQHEVDFRPGAPLDTADNAQTLKWIVENAIMLDGCHASFDPKPLPKKPGNGMQVSIGLKGDDSDALTERFLAGVVAHMPSMGLFLNPLEESYDRLECMGDMGDLVRIATGGKAGGAKRIEILSPDPAANPYLVYALVIWAGLDGIAKGMPPAGEEGSARAEFLLPADRAEAVARAKSSDFIRSVLPEGIIRAYCKSR